MCRSCNSGLGQLLETPIAEAFRGGHKSIVNLVSSRPELVFQWLNLIYFKTHYKDSFVALHKDRGRKEYLDDDIIWRTFHKTHAIARSRLYNINVDRSVIGSLKVFKVKDWMKATNSEYYDELYWSSCWIRFEESVIFCSLKDSNLGNSVLSHETYQFDAELSYFEFLSIVAEFELCYQRMDGSRKLDVGFDRSGNFINMGNSFKGPIKLRALSKVERQLLLRSIFSRRLGRIGVSNDASRIILSSLDRSDFSFLPKEALQNLDLVEYYTKEDR